MYGATFVHNLGVVLAEGAPVVQLLTGGVVRDALGSHVLTDFRHDLVSDYTCVLSAFHFGDVGLGDDHDGVAARIEM